MIKKVALISSTFPNSRPGGAPTFVEGRAAYLRRRLDVRIFALGQPESPNDVSIGQVHAFRRTFLWSWCRLLFALLKYRPDIVEVHNIPVGLPVFVFFYTRYFFHGPAGSEANIDDTPRWRVFIANLLERFAVNWARKILFASHAFRNLFQRLYPEVTASRLRVIYPRLLFFDTSASDGFDARPYYGRYVICLRRLVKRTGVDFLLEAFSKARRRGWIPHDIKLLVCGEGPQRPALEDIARRCSLGPDNVVFLGKVNNRTRDQLFRQAIASIVPTKALEGFGLVVLEAGIQGCPSVVTDVDALPEVINLLGNIGVIVPSTVDGLAIGLKESLRFSNNDRERLRFLVYKRFSATYTETIQSKQELDRAVKIRCLPFAHVFSDTIFSVKEI